jgi:hypothetical protein
VFQSIKQAENVGFVDKKWLEEGRNKTKTKADWLFQSYLKCRAEDPTIGKQLVS